MNCPNCNATDAYVCPPVTENGETVTRRRKCVECRFQFETVEQYVGAVAHQAFQAELFRVVINERNGGNHED